jgi:hypothetical protein
MVNRFSDRIRMVQAGLTERLAAGKLECFWEGPSGKVMWVESGANFGWGGADIDKGIRLMEANRDRQGTIVDDDRDFVE